jgi:hypothetical protein
VPASRDAKPSETVDFEAAFEEVKALRSYGILLWWRPSRTVRIHHLGRSLTGLRIEM